MSRCKLGTTIIDALKVCYEVNVEDLSALTELEYGEWEVINNFSFFRVASQHFAYCYNIIYSECDERQDVAQLRFGRYGERETNVIFAFLHISNQVLYDPVRLGLVLRLPDELGMVFHNITMVDLAKDFTINPVTIIKKLYKDTSTTTIINGKAVKDRKMIIDGVSQSYSVSLDRLKNPTLYFKQAKAIHNKVKGIVVTAYNKMAEIEESGKDYVLEFYGNPKRLNRLEVHLNSQEISDYFKKRGVVQDLSLIMDEAFRSEMYFYHLSSVIRFSKKREGIPWEDILKCNGRVR